LYQRGIYPADEFEQFKKYNMTLMITKDGGLRTYLNSVLGQISGTCSIDRFYVTIEKSQKNSYIY
jgi:hypothetical protein